LDKTLKDEGLACQVTHASSKEEFQAALNKTRFDLVIRILPSPLTVHCRTSRQQETSAGHAFILVSEASGEEQAVESLKSGAADYVLKDHLHRWAGRARALLEAGNGKSGSGWNSSCVFKPAPWKPLPNGII